MSERPGMQGDQNWEGRAVKHDAEKLRYELVPPLAMTEDAAVFTHGAEKYGAGNYLLDGGLDVNRLWAAALRHMIAWRTGERRDSESGLMHLAHARASLAMIRDIEEQR